MEKIERGSMIKSLGALLFGADSTTSETNTISNINGRKSLLKMLRFLRTLPGCENTRLAKVQTETAERETYRIDGFYKITHSDYVVGKVFDDAVSYSYYPIDFTRRKRRSSRSSFHKTDAIMTENKDIKLLSKSDNNMCLSITSGKYIFNFLKK